MTKFIPYFNEIKNSENARSIKPSNVYGCPMQFIYHLKYKPVEVSPGALYGALALEIAVVLVLGS